MGIIYTIVEEETEAQRGPDVQPLALGHTETANATKHSERLLGAEQESKHFVRFTHLTFKQRFRQLLPSPHFSDVDLDAQRI